MTNEPKFPGGLSAHLLVNMTDGSVAVFECRTRTRLSNIVPGGWRQVNSWFERDATVENFAFDIAKHNLSVASVRIVDKADIPKDRSFRNAWTHDFGVDMPRAREIHKNRLRAERAPLLAALDLEATKLITKPDAKKAADIEAAKQALRDATARPEIGAARTPEELKAIAI